MARCEKYVPHESAGIRRGLLSHRLTAAYALHDFSCPAAVGAAVSARQFSCSLASLAYVFAGAGRAGWGCVAGIGLALGRWVGGLHGHPAPYRCRNSLADCSAASQSKHVPESQRVFPLEARNWTRRLQKVQGSFIECMTQCGRAAEISLQRQPVAAQATGFRASFVQPYPHQRQKLGHVDRFGDVVRGSC